MTPLPLSPGEGRVSLWGGFSPGHPCLHCFPQCFSVHSLGWVEMAEEELAPGRSTVAVNNCIRQLAGQEPALGGSWVEVSGWWGGQGSSQTWGAEAAGEPGPAEGGEPWRA